MSRLARYPIDSWIEDILNDLSNKRWEWIQEACDYIRHHITWEWSSRLTNTAGMAYYKRNLIRLSSPIFSDLNDQLPNPIKDCYETLAHEVCHLVSNRIAPVDRHHGKTWKYLMGKLGLTSERCHRFKSVKKRKRVKVQCARCKQDMNLGMTQHKRYLQGVKYTHKKCADWTYNIPMGGDDPPR